MATNEERLTTLEKQQESLSAVLHQFVKTLQEMRKNSSEVSSHVGAILRTVLDNRALTKAGLAESSVLNQLDQLTQYLQSAVKNGMIEPSNGPTTAKSLVVAQQFDSNHEEINRRVLLNVSDMKPEDKKVFEDKNPGNEVTGFSEAPDAVLLIHEIYEPIEKASKPF